MNAAPVRIRVLVVDDSSVIRKIVTEALAADPTIEVVGIATNGRKALEQVEQLHPDAVTMDIEMPEMNGIDAVRAIRKTKPRLPIVMFSTLTERGAAATLDALAAGASDYVAKPSNVHSFEESKRNIREQLIPKLKALAGTRRAASGGGPPKPVPPAETTSRKPRSGPFQALVIGSSTGGPDALAAVLPALPADLPVPVLIVQHMPPLFTRLLAQRLNDHCRLTITEAVEGAKVLPGQALIAPGGKHLTLKRQGPNLIAHLTEDPPENFCRPSVDVLFRSASQIYNDRLLAVVLTGMGRDGEKGATMIRQAGGEVFAQDEATCVVWGMPGAVAMAGQADKVLPLPRIGQEIASAIARGRTPVGVGS